MNEERTFMKGKEKSRGNTQISLSSCSSTERSFVSFLAFLLSFPLLPSFHRSLPPSQFRRQLAGRQQKSFFCAGPAANSAKAVDLKCIALA